MELIPMDAAQYRALDDASLEHRRAEVVAELDNADSTVGMDVLNEEVRLIQEEVERRNQANALRSSRVAAVANGAGALVTGGAQTANPDVSVTRNEDPFDTEDYNRAFYDYTVRGIEYPDGLVTRGMVPENVRADAFTQTSDVPHFIPTTLSNTIIQKMSEYGTIWPKFTKMNVQGGLEISIWDYLPTASWVTEAKPSDTQKATDPSRISFLYYMLEVKVAQSFLSQVTTMDMFQRQFPEKCAEAMVRAIEAAGVNGSGSGMPLGILKDPRLTADNKVTFDEKAIGTWAGWANILKKVKAPYRSRGEWTMTQATWDTYVDGMVDANGQPVARVNYGLDGAHSESYRLMGKNVNIVPEDILPNYEDAKGGAADTPCILFGNLSNYIVNQQMGMRSVRWNDEDKNVTKLKMQTVVDGKLGDTNGLLVISAPKKTA